jgi:hypothetical protein
MTGISLVLSYQVPASPAEQSSSHVPCHTASSPVGFTQAKSFVQKGSSQSRNRQIIRLNGFNPANQFRELLKIPDHLLARVVIRASDSRI